MAPHAQVYPKSGSPCVVVAAASVVVVFFVDLFVVVFVDLFVVVFVFIPLGLALVKGYFVKVLRRCSISGSFGDREIPFLLNALSLIPLN